jgi:TRAP-type transport system periplasmic protein
MPFPEVYSALEQGTVDGQENPYSAINSAKLNEVQKYLSLTRHIYFVAAAVMSKKVWDGLNEEERVILKTSAEAALPRWSDAAKKERAILAARFKESMKINEVAPAEIDRFRQAAKPVVDKYTQGSDPAAVKELFDAIEAVRKR